MANSNVKSFLSKINQGVKPNLFYVSLEMPANLQDKLVGDDLQLANLLCKSAALPASNLGVIEVPFRGRTVKIAGDRTFDTWTATFIGDRYFKIRGVMERWMRAMNAHEANTAELIKPQTSDGYTADIVVQQLERNTTVDNPGGNVLRTYKLIQCFPTNVSQIDLAYDSNDQIEDFTVEFQLQYWTCGTNSPDYNNLIA
jgi:hypothetical protein